MFGKLRYAELNTDQNCVNWY